MEKMYFTVPLRIEGIQSFYDHCAEEMIFCPDVCRYDCRHIEVSKARFDHLEQYYKSKDMSTTDFGMVWLNFGPKVNDELIGEVVMVDDDFLEVVD